VGKAIRQTGKADSCLQKGRRTIPLLRPRRQTPLQNRKHHSQTSHHPSGEQKTHLHPIGRMCASSTRDEQPIEGSRAPTHNTHDLQEHRSNLCFLAIEITKFVLGSCISSKKAPISASDGPRVGLRKRGYPDSEIRETTNVKRA
jgi:hypothetical protein